MTPSKATAAGATGRPAPPRCSVAGCDVKVYERGLCMAHFAELRDRGALPSEAEVAAFAGEG